MSKEKAEEPAEKPTEKSVEETVEEPTEKPTEEKLEKKVKKKKKGVFFHYKIEKDGLKRLLPFCERCGPGYFMADHGNRYTCGHCGFTRYKQVETGS